MLPCSISTGDNTIRTPNVSSSISPTQDAGIVFGSGVPCTLGLLPHYSPALQLVWKKIGEAESPDKKLPNSSCTQSWVLLGVSPPNRS